RFETMAGSPDAIKRLIEMNRHIDIRPALSTVSSPTLVLHREGDRMVPVSHGRYFRDHIAGSRYVELPGEDHWWWTGPDSDAVIQEVEEFLTGTRPEPDVDRVLKTVLFSDIVDSTRRAAELGDRRWRELLDQHDTMVRAALERFDG